MIYFVVFSLLLYFAPLDRLGLRTTYQFVSFTLLLFFLGARWETGTDWDPYIEYFLYLDNYRNFEPGYVFLSESVRLISNNYTVFLFVNGALALAPIFWFVHKEVRGSISLGLMIFYSYYYLITYFGASRRIIAIGLCVLAAMHLLDGKKKSTFILVSIGSLFHYSALVCLMYFALVRNIISIRGAARLLFFVASLCGVIYALLPLLMNISVFSHIYLRVGEYLLLSSSIAGYDKAIPSVFSIIKRLAVIAFIMFTLGRYKNKIGPREVFFANCYILSFGVYLISEFLLGDIFKTFTIYFSIFEIALIPNLIRVYEPSVRLPLYGLFLAYLVLQIYSATFGNPFAELYIPYYLAPDFRRFVE